MADIAAESSTLVSKIAARDSRVPLAVHEHFVVEAVAMGRPDAAKAIVYNAAPDRRWITRREG